MYYYFKLIKTNVDDNIHLIWHYSIIQQVFHSQSQFENMGKDGRLNIYNIPPQQISLKQ